MKKLLDHSPSHPRCTGQDQQAPPPRKDKNTDGGGLSVTANRDRGSAGGGSVAIAVDRLLSPFPATDASNRSVLKCGNCGSCRLFEWILQAAGMSRVQCLSPRRKDVAPVITQER